jgi:Flp pilus assembly protein TadB
MDDLRAEGVDGPEALEVLGRTTLAWQQLRDMGLERSWQNGFGWFLARNLMLFGGFALVLAMSLRIPPAVLEGGLAGAALYYLIVLALMPLRVRRHRRRGAGILEAYGQDLGAYLDALEAGNGGAGEPAERAG